MAHTRREFLKTAAAGAAASGTLPLRGRRLSTSRNRKLSEQSDGGCHQDSGECDAPASFHSAHILHACIDDAERLS